MIKVSLISLGCAKNLVDSEIMVGHLHQAGMAVIPEAEKADVVIVNTCSFIDSAQEESVDTILESAEVREAKNRGQALVVSGCLSQRFRDELPKLFPEVDAFMGIDQVAQVGELVRDAITVRAAKAGTGAKAKGKGQKAKVAKALAELDKSKPVAHDAGESIRGQASFGKKLLEANQQPD